MSKATNVMIGFLSGAAIGVLTGVLIAPAKGSRIRRKIKTKLNDATKTVAASISDQIDHMENKIKHLKKDAEKEARKVRNAASKTENDMSTVGNMM
jgi:gas vesicle protein